MEKIRIIVIEDDDETCQMFQDIIFDYNNLDIIKYTNSSTEAISYIKALCPDAIILDLELHNGEGSGIMVLDAFQTKEIPFKPFVLVTTNNISPITTQLIHSKGADFILKKYQNDYSESQVLDTISAIAEQLFTRRNDLYAKKEKLDSNEQLQKIYKGQILNELNNIRISPNVSAYKYLADAILILINDPDAYYISIISSKYNKKPDNIKRAMQRAIEHTWTREDTVTLSKYYNSTINLKTGAPTIKAFVNYYASKIRCSYK